MTEVSTTPTLCADDHAAYDAKADKQYHDLRTGLNTIIATHAQELSKQSANPETDDILRLVRIGGDVFNESIVRYIKRKRKLVVGISTAEEIKMAIGTVDRRAKETSIEVRGRDTATGLPKMIEVSSLEVQRALEAQMMTILEGIKDILEKTPPELVAAIADHGIILTGGGSLIDGFDRVVSRSIGIAAYLVDDPRYAVIRGVAKALNEMSALKDTLEGLQ